MCQDFIFAFEDSNAFAKVRNLKVSEVSGHILKFGNKTKRSSRNDSMPLFSTIRLSKQCLQLQRDCRLRIFKKNEHNISNLATAHTKHGCYICVPYTLCVERVYSVCLECSANKVCFLLSRSS